MPGLLVASLVALGAGPALDRATRGRAASRAMLGGLLTGMVVGMVVVHVLPESVEAAGTLALPCALLGWALPFLLERLRWQEGRVAAGLIVAGFVVHVLTDGAALVGPPDGSAASSAVGWAIVAHKIPVSVWLWRIVRRAHGLRAAALVLLVEGVLTVVGYGLGASALALGSSAPLAAFQALVGGTLLHVVAERSPFEARSLGSPEGRRDALRIRVGEALGLAVASALGLPALAGHVASERLYSASAIGATLFVAAVALEVGRSRRLPLRGPVADPPSGDLPSLPDRDA